MQDETLETHQALNFDQRDLIIKTLKNNYVMSKSHCTSQLNDWALYQDSGTDILISDMDLTFTDTDELSITTENFDKNTTIYLKNI